MKLVQKLLGAATLAVASFAPVAQADVVYTFTNPPASGSAIPGLPAGQAFASATFAQTLTGLRLTMQVFGNISGATIDEWYFNVIAGVNASHLTWVDAGVAGTIPIQPQGAGDAGLNCCGANGTGLYDFVVNFLEPSHQLASGSSGVVDISYSDRLLTLADIQAVSAPNGQGGGAGGGFGAAIHVQEIGTSGASGWFTSNCVVNPNTRTCETPDTPTGETPEPGVLALLGIGLSAWAIARRRRS